jgi:hypothetical protein
VQSEEKRIYVSEEYIAPFYRMEKERARSRRQTDLYLPSAFADFLLSSFFGFEDGGDVLLRNVDCLLQDYRT